MTGATGATAFTAWIGAALGAASGAATGAQPRRSATPPNPNAGSAHSNSASLPAPPCCAIELELRRDARADVGVDEILARIVHDEMEVSTLREQPRRDAQRRRQSPLSAPRVLKNTTSSFARQPTGQRQRLGKLLQFIDVKQRCVLPFTCVRTSASCWRSPQDGG